MAIDSSRYFAISSTLLQWDKSPEETLQLAHELLKKCMLHQASSSPGTLYVGKIGSIFLLYKLAQATQEAQKRNQFLQQAWEEIQSADCKKLRMRAPSLLEDSFVGVRCLYCIISNAMGNTQHAMEHANSLVERLREACHKLPESDCEVLYGRAGALQAIMFLRRELNSPTLGSEFVLETAKHIVRRGLEGAKQVKNQPSCRGMPLVWEWYETLYLGAARGIVGILHTLLGLHPGDWKQMKAEFPGLESTLGESLDHLQKNCSFASGNLFPCVGDEKEDDRLVHWCHGAPGHVLLLQRASEVLKEPSLLQQAEQITDSVVWPRGLLRTKGVGLCHGIAGNAYVFLALHDNKDDTRSIWHQRARHYAAFAIQHLESLLGIPDRPYSLFEGLGGLVALLIDLGHPREECSYFPLYG